jgi:hypothetical protein
MHACSGRHQDKRVEFACSRQAICSSSVLHGANLTSDCQINVWALHAYKTSCSEGTQDSITISLPAPRPPRTARLGLATAQFRRERKGSEPIQSYQGKPESEQGSKGAMKRSSRHSPHRHTSEIPLFALPSTMGVRRAAERDMQ